MKVTIEIDCTPDEARQFLGLPDLKPMQAALMARMEAQMAEAADRFSPDAMLRSWMSLVPQTPDQWKAGQDRGLTGRAAPITPRPASPGAAASASPASPPRWPAATPPS